MGARHSGGTAEAGPVGGSPRLWRCPGCSASLGLAVPAPRWSPYTERAGVAVGETGSPAQATAGAGGARAHVQLRVHVGASACTRARRVRGGI